METRLNFKPDILWILMLIVPKALRRFTLLFIIIGTRAVVAVQGQSTDCLSLHPQVLSSACSAQCAGSAVRLDAGEGFAFYQWSNGAHTRSIIVSSAEASGLYSCGVSNDGLCFAKSNSVEVVIRPTVPKPPIVQADTLLVTAAAEHYVWYLNGHALEGHDESSLRIEQKGEYAVMSVNEYGCTSLSNTLRVDHTHSSGASRNRDARLRIYPNPTNGIISVQLESDFEGNIELSVVDMSGRPVFSSTWNQPRPLDVYHINLSENSSGSYMLIARDGVDVVQERIILQK